MHRGKVYSFLVDYCNFGEKLFVGIDVHPKLLPECMSNGLWHNDDVDSRGEKEGEGVMPSRVIFKIEATPEILNSFK